jgi:hypothetical protein
MFSWVLERRKRGNKINIVLIMRRVVLALVGHEKLAIHDDVVGAVACCTIAQHSSLKQKNAQRKKDSE